ncbi:serine hydrolase domain-containing protein [uncultured Croceitalea sp.]|uniref:serine hydrolase domain-containing protein n=1 Tax=uncultured Croceitalea sp. TaxID=1798908 RepID=UPI0033062FE6
MKFVLLKITAILPLLLFSCNGIKPSIETGFDTDTTRQQKISEYFNALSDLGQFNGVILIQDEDSRPFVEAYNLSEDENANIYVTTKSQFDIHSVSKLFAKAIILDMEQKGQISRTDLLNAYIPDFPKGDKITIQHLMDNTSGLPREPKVVGTAKNKLTDQEIVEWAKKQRLEFEPGTDKRYSNVGYELLYYIIGKMNYSSFPFYIKNTLFSDLGMTASGTHYYTDKSNLKHWAKNYQLDDDSMVQVQNITDDDFKQSMLYSTAEDLLKFLRYVSKASFKDELKTKDGVIAWTGGSEGIRAYVHTNVEKDYSFIVLANFDDIPLNDIISTTWKIMESKPYDLPKAIKRESIVLDSETLNKYVGTYDFVDADHLLLDFKTENNSLSLYQGEELMAVLNAESDGVFFVDPASEESFEFRYEGKTQIVVAGWKGVKLKGIKQ